MIFLSWTLVTGEGGMLWLCQITFAGVGALTTAELANHQGWPVLAAVVAGGVVALGLGALIGFLSIRLGDLYVALVTLTFGLLIENLIFTLPTFVNQGLGVTLNRPDFAASDIAFAYVCLAVFVVVSLFVVNLRRSTTGLALNAARWSEAGARTSGISVVQMKVLAGATAAFIAGIGGGLLAVSQGTVVPGSFATFAGIVWFASLVTIGIRSTAAALVAGLAFVMLPALCQAYLADLGQLAAGRLRHGRHLGGQVPRRDPGGEEPAAAPPVRDAWRPTRSPTTTSPRRSRPAWSRPKPSGSSRVWLVTPRDDDRHRCRGPPAQARRRRRPHWRPRGSPCASEG